MVINSQKDLDNWKSRYEPFAPRGFRPREYRPRSESILRLVLVYVGYYSFIFFALVLIIFLGRACGF